MMVMIIDGDDYRDVEVGDDYRGEDQLGRAASSIKLGQGTRFDLRVTL